MPLPPCLSQTGWIYECAYNFRLGIGRKELVGEFRVLKERQGFVKERKRAKHEMKLKLQTQTQADEKICKITWDWSMRIMELRRRIVLSSLWRIVTVFQEFGGAC